MKDWSSKTDLRIVSSDTPFMSNKLYPVAFRKVNSHGTVEHVPEQTTIHRRIKTIRNTNTVGISEYTIPTETEKMRYMNK